LLFLGFGTSTGAALIADDVVIPFEIGMLKLTKRDRFMDRLTREAFVKNPKRWLPAAYEAIEIMRDVFKPDDVLIGGGNGKEIEPLPKGCRRQDNQAAFKGAERLWPGAELLAEPYGTSWRIKRKKKKK